MLFALPRVLLSACLQVVTVLKPSRAKPLTFLTRRKSTSLFSKEGLGRLVVHLPPQELCLVSTGWKLELCQLDGTCEVSASLRPPVAMSGAIELRELGDTEDSPLLNAPPPSAALRARVHKRGHPARQPAGAALCIAICLVVELQQCLGSRFPSCIRDGNCAVEDGGDEVAFLRPEDGETIQADDDEDFAGLTSVAIDIRTRHAFPHEAWICIYTAAHTEVGAQTCFCPMPAAADGHGCPNPPAGGAPTMESLQFALPLAPNEYEIVAVAINAGAHGGILGAARVRISLRTRMYPPSFALSALASARDFVLHPDHAAAPQRRTFLIWNVVMRAPEPYSWFLSRIATSLCNAPFAVSVVRSMLGDADVVLFSLEYLRYDDLPRAKRHGQIWIGSRHENYAVNPKMPLPAHFIDQLDYFSTFSPDTNVSIEDGDGPNIPALLASEWNLARSAADLFGLFDEPFPPYTERLQRAVMVITRCDAPSGRTQFLRELMQHYPIDSYGKCLNNMGDDGAQTSRFYYGSAGYGLCSYGPI